VGEGVAVDGLDFGFQTGQAFKISGTVIDPGRDKRSGIPDFYLIPLVSGEGRVLETPRMAQNAMGPNRAPGSFELRGVRPGRYLLYAEDWLVEPRGDNFVVAQVTLDVASDISDVTLVMTGTSIVEGVVRNAAQQPASNVRVALIPPEDRRSHPMFYKEVRSDASGRFTIKGVMPGEYTLYAVDPATFKDSTPLPSMYGLPAFLTPYQQQGVAVRTVGEERVTISVSPLVRP
jgi:Carboxypeptidase regulatory-like domain